MFKYILIIALLTITATCADSAPWRVLPPAQYNAPGLTNARNYGLNNIIAQLATQKKIASASGWRIVTNNSISTYNTSTDLYYMFNLTLNNAGGDLLNANFVIDVNRKSTVNSLVSNSTSVKLKTTTGTTPGTTTGGTNPSFYCNITLYGSNTVSGKKVSVVKNYQLSNLHSQIWVPKSQAQVQHLDYITYQGSNCLFKLLLWHNLDFAGSFVSYIITDGTRATISSSYADSTQSFKLHYPIPGDRHFPGDPYLIKATGTQIL